MTRCPRGAALELRCSASCSTGSSTSSPRPSRSEPCGRLQRPPSRGDGALVAPRHVVRGRDGAARAETVPPLLRSRARRRLRRLASSSGGGGDARSRSRSPRAPARVWPPQAGRARAWARRLLRPAAARPAVRSAARSARRGRRLRLALRRPNAAPPSRCRPRAPPTQRRSVPCASDPVGRASPRSCRRLPRPATRDARPRTDSPHSPHRGTGRRTSTLLAPLQAPRAIASAGSRAVDTQGWEHAVAPRRSEQRSSRALASCSSPDGEAHASARREAVVPCVLPTTPRRAASATRSLQRARRSLPRARRGRARLRSTRAPATGPVAVGSSASSALCAREQSWAPAADVAWPSIA